MGEQRIAGQDTQVSIVVDGTPIATIRAIKSFEINFKLTIKSEEYTGETGPRKDDFYEGMSGRLEIDLENSDALTLIQTIVARAQNRALNTRISTKTTLQFPDGERVIINIPNMFFSDIPLGFASRTEYGKVTLSWEAETGKIVSR